MENVLIFDDFLDPTEIQQLDTYVSNKRFSYGHTSGYGEKITNQFFSIYNEEDFFKIYIKEKIEAAVNRKFKLKRHYMHVQPFGLDGSYHIDDDGDNKWTFCIYYTSLSVEMFENQNAGGEFFLKIPGQLPIVSIETYTNRGIFFPSTYLHKGMAYNKDFGQMRLCLTWKMEEII
jgi:hypothetical protein